MLKIFKYPSAYANLRYLFDYHSYIPYHQLSFLQAMPACLRPNHRPEAVAEVKVEASLLCHIFCTSSVVGSKRSLTSASWSSTRTGPRHPDRPDGVLGLCRAAQQGWGVGGGLYPMKGLPTHQSLSPPIQKYLDS